MIDETVQLEDDEELEEEAEAEVDKVLFELTDGKLGQAGSVGTELPASVVLAFPLHILLTSFIRSPRTTPRRKKSGGKWKNTESSSMDCSVVDFALI